MEATVETMTAVPTAAVETMTSMPAAAAPAAIAAAAPRIPAIAVCARAVAARFFDRVHGLRDGFKHRRSNRSLCLARARVAAAKGVMAVCVISLASLALGAEPRVHVFQPIPATLAIARQPAVDGGAIKVENLRQNLAALTVSHTLDVAYPNLFEGLVIKFASVVPSHSKNEPIMFRQGIRNVDLLTS
jgi:putative intracellular protease/amidase